MFNVLSDNALRFLSEADAKRQKGRKSGQCIGTLYSELQTPRANRGKLEALRGKVKDLLAAWNELEPMMVLSGPTAAQNAAIGSTSPPIGSSGGPRKAASGTTGPMRATPRPGSGLRRAMLHQRLR